jgi:hypothetical protein
LKIGRPELIDQINSGHREAHSRFDANLERVLQAEDKRTEIFKELIQRNDGMLRGGAALEQQDPDTPEAGS